MNASCRPHTLPVTVGTLKRRHSASHSPFLHICAARCAVSAKMFGNATTDLAWNGPGQLQAVLMEFTGQVWQ